MSETPVAREPSGPDPDLSGRRLGDYQLLRRLGRGGMADVYLAEQMSLRRRVAFKVLKRSLAEDQAYVRRFHNEAQAAASLVHANIVQIHEVGCIEGVHFIAQEYVAGQNLKQWLSRHRTADSKMAVHIMRQVSAALNRAAQQGIIHRDIKPENIMLATTGEVKVADFGLARVATDGQAVNLTQVGVTMGTPLYMSPEQVEGKSVDPRSDLYSLGVTGYHMLANRPPFQGDTALAVAVQHLKHEPQSLAELRPDVQRECPALISVIGKLMAKKADERPASATGVLRELRGLLPEAADDVPWDESLLTTPPTEVMRPSSVTAATQQLQTLLRAESTAKTKTARFSVAPLLIVFGCVLSALAIGAGAAYAFRPRPLLEFDPAALPTIEKFETPSQQWFYATMATKNVEQAWRAVEKYFPAEQSPVNLRYARQAKIGLANYYRSQRQSESALTLYDELAKVEEAEFRLAGTAGRAIVLDQLKRPDDAAEVLKSVIPRRNQISDESLRSGVERLAAKYGIKLDMP